MLGKGVVVLLAFPRCVIHCRTTAANAITKTLPADDLQDLLTFTVSFKEMPS